MRRGRLILAGKAACFGGVLMVAFGLTVAAAIGFSTRTQVMYARNLGTAPPPARSFMAELRAGVVRMWVVNESAWLPELTADDPLSPCWYFGELTPRELPAWRLAQDGSTYDHEWLGLVAFGNPRVPVSARVVAWPFAVVPTLLGAWLLRRSWKNRPRPGSCASCGYSNAGLPSGPCP